MLRKKRAVSYFYNDGSYCLFSLVEFYQNEELFRLYHHSDHR